MRVPRRLSVIFVLLNDTERYSPTPAGIEGLGHKERHNPFFRHWGLPFSGALVWVRQARLSAVAPFDSRRGVRNNGEARTG